MIFTASASHFHAQNLGHGDDGEGDFHVVALVGNVVYEALVYFESVEPWCFIIGVFHAQQEEIT